jgi:hypothetical protein
LLKLSVLLLALGALVSGCGTAPALKPPGPSEAIPDNSSRLLLRSTGMPMNVDYSVGAADASCKELTKVGTVRDKGENVLLPWIVKLSEKLSSVSDQLETLAPAGQAVQVASWGNWQDTKSKGNCGPVIMSFVPAEKHTYLVEFVWQGTASCMSRVYDVTDPASKVAVPAAPKTCPRSFIDIWLGRSGL